jgi:ABC-type multidrug transport system fused ATPase/permease subunit
LFELLLQAIRIGYRRFYKIRDITKQHKRFLNKKNILMKNLLYVIAVVLIIGWAVGFLGFLAGGIIHVLLVIALIAIILQLSMEEKFFRNYKKALIKIQGMDNNYIERKISNTELEKSKAHIIAEIIEYMANYTVIKMIIKKSKANIWIMSFANGEG